MSLSPLIPTPFSDLTWLFYLQPHAYLPGTFCTELYLKYCDCVEAYGMSRGKFKCADLYFDVQECMSGKFQGGRAQAIRQERMKQYKEGKLSEPFEQRPPPDSYFYV